MPGTRTETPREGTGAGGGAAGCRSGYLLSGRLVCKGLSLTVAASLVGNNVQRRGPCVLRRRSLRHADLSSARRRHPQTCSQRQPSSPRPNRPPKPSPFLAWVTPPRGWGRWSRTAGRPHVCSEYTLLSPASAATSIIAPASPTGTFRSCISPARPTWGPADSHRGCRSCFSKSGRPFSLPPGEPGP